MCKGDRILAWSRNSGPAKFFLYRIWLEALEVDALNCVGLCSGQAVIKSDVRRIFRKLLIEGITIASIIVLFQKPGDGYLESVFAACSVCVE